LYFAIAMLAVAIGYFAFTVSQGAATYYLTVGDLVGGHAETGQRLRVAGKLVQGSFQREGQGLQARFSLTDGTHVLPAVYEGTLPDLFFSEEAEIVLEGNYGQDAVFYTTTTPIVKCPSKYQAEASQQGVSPPSS